MSIDVLKSVTVQQFKDYFYRDFPYLPLYNPSKVYFKGDIVFSNDVAYQSLIDNNTDPLSTATSWKVVNVSKDDYVTDQDILKAMSQAIITAKYCGDSDEEAINIYLHLVAYYLVVDLKNASQGVGSSYSAAVSSKSVGDVSESYAIPQWMLDNPMYSMFAQNGYGLKYLSLIAPFLAVTIIYSRGCSTYE